MPMHRRDFCLSAAALLMAGSASAKPGPRLAAIDWAMLETAISLGVMPVAATELIQFRKDAVEPEIPDAVVDLGLRGAPNFELLHLLRPDLILSSPFYTRHQVALERISPIMSQSFYVKGEPPFEKARAAVSALGRRLDRGDMALAVLGETDRQIAAYRNDLTRFADRPIYLANVGDARHVRVFGADSMFGDMLGRLGLQNAWPDRSRYTFAAPVPIEELVAREEARIVMISDIPVEARTGLAKSMIWNSLAPVKQRRLLPLANINPYGGILAGMRFARLLHSALLAADERAQ